MLRNTSSPTARARGRSGQPDLEQFAIRKLGQRVIEHQPFQPFARTSRLREELQLIGGRQTNAGCSRNERIGAKARVELRIRHDRHGRGTLDGKRAERGIDVAVMPVLRVHGIEPHAGFARERHAGNQAPQFSQTLGRAGLLDLRGIQFRRVSWVALPSTSKSSAKNLRTLTRSRHEGNEIAIPARRAGGDATYGGRDRRGYRGRSVECRLQPPSSAGFSLRGLLVAFGLVALGLPVAFAGLFGVIAQIDRFNAGVTLVREAQLHVADLHRLQSDEETAVRGFASTADPAFRDMYRAAVTEFPVHADEIAKRLAVVSSDGRAPAALADARELNARWRAQVAEPSIANAQRPIDNRRSALYVNRFRSDVDVMSAELIESYHRLLRDRSSPQRKALWIAFGALAVVALQILVYAFLVGRLRGELVRERRVVAVLQGAFTSEIVHDARLDVAAMYVSATRGAKVGGDVYDIFPLDAQRTLIVIADVSGKGVGAAVDSTFVKYSLRAFASESAAISTIVEKFNALYGRAQKPPEAFVVLFAGILDHRMATLTYVNAGHEAAYVRRAETIEQLAPTGPIIGIDAAAPFASAETAIAARDLLFLSTDGLTEARDPSGRFLTGSGVEAWMREADASSAQRFVDSIARRLRRYTRHRNSDDLAILAVRTDTDRVRVG
jgi:hypothetical protein